jgi:SWI/SNF-related matrix-associated actin-dependent regulator 1 of chromatin subfamily A
MIDELFPYQQEGAAWLQTQRWCLLADEMGLGKTAQVLEAINQTDFKEALIICPAIARLNWYGEQEKFARRDFTLSVVSFDSTFQKGGKRKVQPKKELCRPWPLLVIDESHYLSNPEAQRTQAVYLHIAPYASRVWCLSGTPVRNHNGDMFTFLRAGQVISMTHSAFVARYCITRHTVYGDQIVGSQRHDELKDIMAPYVLRRRKIDVLPQLPKIIFCDVRVEPAEVDIDRYYTDVYLGMTRIETIHDAVKKQNDALEAMFDVYGEGAEMTNALAQLNDARQYESRRWVELQKTPRVAEIITEELLSDCYKKIVVFCWHKNGVEDMADRLRQFNPVTVWGGTAMKARKRAEIYFQGNPECRVFVGNIQAAGIAITLTAACEVAFVGSSYVPADNAQAAMRVHRIGQTEPVRVRFFSVANSIDQRVQMVLKRKTRDIVQLMGDDKPAFNPLD